MRKTPPIKTRFIRLLLLPSFLCLDAPLVALGWAACLASRSGETALGPRPAEGVALFGTVWAIYLADRAFGGKARGRVPGMTGEIPPRHLWAGRHWRLLLGLSVFPAAGVLASLPFLRPATVTTGAVVAIATGFHFLLFRYSGFARHRRAVLPGKEITIAICFTLGTGVAAGAGQPWELPWWPQLALGCLVLGNCLLVARTEAAYDARADPAAYYARGPGHPRFPETALAAALLLGATSFLSGESASAALGVVLCAALTLALAHSRDPRVTRLTQPLADAILLLSWGAALAGPVLSNLP